MEQFKAYEAQIDCLIAAECFHKLAANDARTSHFLQKGRGSGIVLKNDMKLELGGCQTTFSILLPSSIDTSGVFLCGEDLDTKAPSLPFGQVVKVAGESFDEEMYYQLGQVLHGMMQADGYMVKKSNQAFLCRISKQAAQNGLSFAVLGEILIRRIRERFTNIENVQIFYITSPAVEFHKWQASAEGISQTLKKVQASVWQSRGIDVNECLKLGHCGKCSSKDVCDKAREIGLEIVTNMKSE